jgi:glycosyltransferase involved in cell wall biosynthesis
MRVAILHNFYLDSGGEDVVFYSEADLLRQHGHTVLTYTVSNELIHQITGWQAAQLAIWNHQIYQDLKQWFLNERPDVAHFHNILFVLSPAAYQAAYEAGVPVVQTLHNYRLICPGGQLLRNHRPCELCVGKRVPLAGIYYGCYKSRSATLTVALHIMTQRRRHQWERDIQVFIALTEFSRQKFIQGGLPAEKVVVKPNFVDPDPGAGEHQGNYALFAGRLSPEKGVAVLLEAWRLLPPSIPLKIVGDGPLAEAVRQATDELPHVEWLGRVPRDQVWALMKEARMLVFPSTCYETMGLSIVEAFATGLPVVASNHGSMASLIRHGETGWLFTPGDAEALRDSVQTLMEHPDQLRAMGRQARAEYLQHYTAERNYEQLIAIYQRAIQLRKGDAPCVC